MPKTNIKITNLTIYSGPSEKHILEARYNDESIKALLITTKPEKIIAMINILKAATPDVHVYSFIHEPYSKFLATRGAPKTRSP